MREERLAPARASRAEAGCAGFGPQSGPGANNIENHTRDEAAALVRRAEGGERVCMRFYRRADGTVLTADCPVGVRSARRRALALAGRAAAVLLVALGTLAGSSGCSRSSRARQRQPEPLKSIINWIDPPAPQRLMGDVACPPPPRPAPAPQPAPARTPARLPDR